MGTVLLNRAESKEDILVERNPDQVALLRGIRDHYWEMMAILNKTEWTEKTFFRAKRHLEESNFSDDIHHAALRMLDLRQFLPFDLALSY